MTIFASFAKIMVVWSRRQAFDPERDRHSASSPQCKQTWNPMSSTKTGKKKKRAPFADIWTGYSIILVHLLFVVALATAMIFIQALSEYFIYVLIGGFFSALLLFLLIYRRIKKDGRQMVDNLQKASSQYGHDIKIDLMGGMASIAIRNQQPPADTGPLQLPENAPPSLQALPSPDQKAAEIRSELLRLAELCQNNLIDRSEFELLKKALLSSSEEFPSELETPSASRVEGV